MRRLTLMAALAAALALAGCTLKTPEGAACDHIGLSDQCPEGQRCGADGVCSVAAVACGPTICTASSCSGQAGNETLNRCDQSGACASLTPVTCNAHQTCNEGEGRCDCVESTECAAAAEGKACAAGGTTLITCSLDGPCPYKTTQDDCAAAGKDCVGTFPNAQCECPQVGDAEGAGCILADLGLEKCTGQVLLTCARRVANSECYTWQFVEDCSMAGLLCNPGAQGSCVCPAHPPGSKTLRADPGATAHAGTEPNGMDPLACRFSTLGEAIAKANDGDTVKAMATPVDPFREPGFTIKSRVAVVGDQSNPAQPGNVVVELTGIGTQGVVVESDASLTGVTVRRGAGAAAATGIEIRGASQAGSASLADVVVDKTASTDAFDTGVLVSGSGAVSVQRLGVRDATVAGLEVNRAAMAEDTSVSSSSLAGNGTGLKLTLGSLSMTDSVVRSSVADGIVADGGATGTTRLSMSGGAVLRNGGTGLVASLNDSLHVTGVRICANSGAIRDLAAGSRTAGGVYLLGDAPTDLLFRANLIHHNSGDQVLVGASGATRWNLATASCVDSERNALAGYAGTTVAGVGLSAISAKVDAWWNSWKTTSLPAPNVDFLVLGTGAEVNARGSGAQYCPPPGLLDTDCPP